MRDDIRMNERTCLPSPHWCHSSPNGLSNSIKWISAIGPKVCAPHFSRSSCALHLTATRADFKKLESPVSVTGEIFLVHHFVMVMKDFVCFESSAWREHKLDSSCESACVATTDTSRRGWSLEMTIGKVERLPFPYRTIISIAWHTIMNMSGPTLRHSLTYSIEREDTMINAQS